MEEEGARSRPEDYGGEGGGLWRGRGKEKGGGAVAPWGLRGGAIVWVCLVLSIVFEYILGELTTVIIFSVTIYLIKGLNENLLITVSLIIALVVSFIIASGFTKKLIYRKKKTNVKECNK